jgi:cytochrome c-type biogenesis protein CcmE
MTPRRKRFAVITVAFAALAAVAVLVLNAFEDNLLFFFSPSQIHAQQAPLDRPFRIGGLVEPGSVRRDGLLVHFVVTDLVHTVPVTYRGILPDLFKEGKGVVARGRLDAGGAFTADQVLAKHDENYMPPEAALALEQARQGKLPTAPAKAY